jgi:molybdenum cofactor synthesis domain-containing protein
MSEPIRVGILTVSDGVAWGERRDESGPAIEDWAATNAHVVVQKAIVADDAGSVASVLLEWTDAGDLDVVLTTGGTGFTMRDVTPEGTLQVIERHAPGIAEAIRSGGARNTPYSWLSRGVAGIRGRTLIVNLPGSVSGTRDGLAVLDPLLRHAVQLLRGDRTHEHG